MLPPASILNGQVLLHYLESDETSVRISGNGPPRSSFGRLGPAHTAEMRLAPRGRLFGGAIARRYYIVINVRKSVSDNKI